MLCKLTPAVLSLLGLLLLLCTKLQTSAFSLRSKRFAMKMQSSFDYLVIGGGSGGLATAQRAAGYGAKVAVVEGSRLGGTCVNVGCVPKKVMFNAATVAETIHEAKHFGFTVDNYSFDWKRLKDAREKYILRLNGIYQRNLANNKVQLFSGFAKFVDANTVDVNGEHIQANNICIAVGGKPTFPKLSGIEHCISSDGFFALERQPQSVAIVGGGYIGVELAGVLSALGTSTTLVTRGPVPLGNFDDLIVTELMKEMVRQKIAHIGNENTKAIRKDAGSGKLFIVSETGQEYGPFDEIIMAAGREPNLKPLNIDAAGIKTTKTGYIAVDEYQTTSSKSVFAIGDACGRVQLTPMAIAAGRLLADRLFGNVSLAKADYENVPSIVFSHPPIGVVGMTEKEAVAKFGADKVKTFSSTFTNLWYGPFDIDVSDKPKTTMKLITTLPDERVVGIHMIGKGCDEILQGFAVALKMGAKKSDLDKCVALHPTAAEELVTLKPWGLPLAT